MTGPRTDIALLPDTPRAVQWLRTHLAPGAQLHADSRCVRPGDAFFAWPGARTDGRAHLAAACAAGAATVLLEAAGLPDSLRLPALPDLPLAAVPGLQASAGPIARLWHGAPDEALALLAVTGTNGKTSSAWGLARALARVALPGAGARRGCAFAGTLGLGLPDVLQDAPQPAATTTPCPLRLHAALRQWADAGLAACALEASSIGLATRRLVGSRIRAAIFTNFTRDHLDWHGSMEAYWQAKAALFDWPGLEAAVLNVDDARGAQLWHRLRARDLDLWSVSIDAQAAAAQPARLVARNIAINDLGGMDFSVCEGRACVPVRSTVPGRYQVSNLLGVLATLRSLGVTLEQAALACTDLPPVPGRMQRIGPPGPAGAHLPLVFVDYAHTPDALAQALAALRPLAARRGGALHCVFGCGGARDTGKRPLMARAASLGSDHLCITSDNPRDEDPCAIMAQIAAGLPPGHRAHEEPQRARAIAQTIARAGARDVVLIAGKGHERWQEVGAGRLPFSDAAEARAALQRRTQEHTA